MRKFFIVLIGLLFLSTNQYLYAQSLPPADKLVDAATDVFKNKSEKEGVAYFEAAMQKALDEDNHIVYLNLIAALAYAYIDFTGDDMKTVEAFERAYRLPFKVKTEKEFECLAGIFTYLGYTYSESIGDFAAAVKPYKRAFDVFENELKEVSVYRALNLEKYLGNIYTRQGDYEAAEVHLKFALEVLLDHKEYDEAAFITSDLGLLYQTWGKFYLADSICQKGFSFPSQQSTTKILLLLNYSNHLLEQNKIEEALVAVNEIDRLLLLNLDDENLNFYRAEYKGASFEKKALIKMKKGEYKEAYAAIESGIDQYIDYFGTDKRREIAKLHITASNILLKMDDFEGSIAANQKALTCILHQYDPKNKFDLPPSSLFRAENTIWEALEGVAKAYQAQYKIEGNTILLQKALECYGLINKVESHLRRSYLYDNSKLFNLEESRRLSEKAIILAHQLYETTGDANYLYQAFIFAERNRSSLLREALQTTAASSLAGLSEEELTHEKHLNYQVSKAREVCFNLIGEGTTDSLIQVADQTLLQANDALDNWVKSLEVKHPKYYQLKYEDQLPSLEEYQAMLSAKQLMIEYFVGKEHIYVFTINKKELELQFLSLPENLTQKVLDWRQSMEGYLSVEADQIQLKAQYIQGGYQLYATLLETVLKDHQSAKDLLIIPSGILDLLPFEALLQNPAKIENSYNELPYLIQNYTIGYCYSASLYHSLGQLSKQGEGVGGFAPNFDNSTSWPNLSCSTEMLENLDVSWQKELKIGADATTEQFRKVAAQYQILHLATHAQSNAEFGDFSFIVFHNEQGGYDSLFAKDLYLENIEAELVILSACETALGTLYDSEGVISLARAFHYAGARSVVTTLWSINEGANCHIMEFFYDELANNQSKPEALRKAKIRYLKEANANAAHPVFWAGFQFSGNPRPITPSKLLWFVLGGLPLAAGALFFARKKKVA